MTYRVEYLNPNIIGTGGKWTVLSKHWFRWRAFRALSKRAFSGNHVPEWRITANGAMVFECRRYFGCGSGGLLRFAPSEEVRLDR